MDCDTFQESASEYLEGRVSGQPRVALASHLMQCADCRELYEDVRATRALCRDLQDPVTPTDLPDRILSVTTAGEMMSCNIFDELISDYFDGYVRASEFQVFQSHFERCPRCSRLLEAIRLARELCREIKNVDVPEDLPDRILATTSALTEERRSESGSGWHFPRVPLRAYTSRVLDALSAPESIAASILLLATFGFLLVNFSDDHSLGGIYRRARFQLARAVGRNSDMAAEKAKLSLDLQQIQFQISSAISSGTSFFGRIEKRSRETSPKPPNPSPKVPNAPHEQRKPSGGDRPPNGTK